MHPNPPEILVDGREAGLLDVSTISDETLCWIISETRDLSSCWDAHAHSGFFPSWDVWIFLQAATTNTQTLRGAAPPRTLCDVHKQTNKQTDRASQLPPGSPRPPQACGCFRGTLSAICLVLYRDSPIPTAAIVMATGLTTLLCGCICTSPETCRCNGMQVNTQSDMR